MVVIKSCNYFVLQVDRAYKLLQAFQDGEVEGRACVDNQIATGAAWRESQELFELPVSEYIHLQKCQVSIAYCSLSKFAELIVQSSNKALLGSQFFRVHKWRNLHLLRLRNCSFVSVLLLYHSHASPVLRA